MRTQARSPRQTMYRSAFAMLALAAACGASAGCGGGDGDGGGPHEAFVGRWVKVLEPSASGFGLVCTDANFADYNIASLLIWPSIDFEHGVTTDLIETSGNCPIQGLKWDIGGKVATVPDPDPVVDDVPACGFDISWQDAGGLILPGLVVIQPRAADWKFTLLGTKDAAGAPLAELGGTADVDILLLDEVGAVVSQTAPACSYAGTDRYFRLTQP
jgi:hypothetical protein